MNEPKEENFKSHPLKGEGARSLITDISRSYTNKQERVNAINAFIQKSSYNAQFPLDEEEEDDESEGDTFGKRILQFLSNIFPDISPVFWFCIHLVINFIIISINLSSLSDPEVHKSNDEPMFQTRYIFGGIYCGLLILLLNMLSFLAIMILHAIAQKMLMERIIQPSALCAAIYNTIDPELLYVFWATAQHIYWRSNIVSNNYGTKMEYYILRIFGHNDDVNPFVFLKKPYWLITFSTILYIIFASRLLCLSIISFVFELGFLMNAHDLLSKYLKKYGILRRFNIEWFMYVADKRENIKSLFGYELYQDEQVIKQLESKDLSKKLVQEKVELLLFKNLPRNCICCKMVLKKNQRNTMRLLLPSIFEEKNIIQSETSTIKNWLACHYVVNTPPLLFLLNNSIVLTNKDSIKNGSEIFFKQILMSLKIHKTENDEGFVFTELPEVRNASNDVPSFDASDRNRFILKENKDTHVYSNNKRDFASNTATAPRKENFNEPKREVMQNGNIAGTKMANLENIFYDIEHETNKKENQYSTDENKSQQSNTKNKTKSKMKGKKGGMTHLTNLPANMNTASNNEQCKTKGKVGNSTNNNEKGRKHSNRKRANTDQYASSQKESKSVKTKPTDHRKETSEGDKDIKCRKGVGEEKNGVAKFNKLKKGKIKEEHFNEGNNSTHKSNDSILNLLHQEKQSSKPFQQEDSVSVSVEISSVKVRKEDDVMEGNIAQENMIKENQTSSLIKKECLQKATKEKEDNVSNLTSSNTCMFGKEDLSLQSDKLNTEKNLCMAANSLHTELDIDDKTNEIKINAAKATIHDEKEVITFKNELNIKSKELSKYQQLENYESFPLEINDFAIEDVIKKKYTTNEKLQKKMFEANISYESDQNTDSITERHQEDKKKTHIKKEDIEVKKDDKCEKKKFEKNFIVGSQLAEKDLLRNNAQTYNNLIPEESNTSLNRNLNLSVKDFRANSVIYDKKTRKLSMLEKGASQKKLKTRTSINKNAFIYQSHLLNEELNLLERSDALNLKKVKDHYKKNKICKCLCRKSYNRNKISNLRRDISLEIDNPFIGNMRSSAQLNIEGNEYITKDMIEIFLKPEEADEFMKEFDLSGHGKIDMTMFKNAIKRAITCRKKFIKSLKGQESILKLVRRLMSILMSFLSAVIILFIFGVSADTIIVTGAALITAITVILSYMYTSFITSVIFIAFSNPYNIGDRIRLDGGEAMYIRKIKTYTTEFETTTGKIVIYENSKLSNAKIYNESRSKNAYIDITFKVDINTPLIALKELRKSLQFLVDSRPSDFCKTKNLYYGYQLQPGYFYEVSFWIKCVEGWGNWRKVFELRTDVYDFVILQLRLLNISYRLPTQKIGFTAPLNVIDNYGGSSAKYTKGTKASDLLSTPKESRNPLFTPAPKHSQIPPFDSNLLLNDEDFDNPYYNRDYSSYMNYKKFVNNYEKELMPYDSYNMNENTHFNAYSRETHMGDFYNERYNANMTHTNSFIGYRGRDEIEKERMERQYRKRQYAEMMADLEDSEYMEYYQNIPYYKKIVNPTFQHDNVANNRELRHCNIQERYDRSHALHKILPFSYTENKKGELYKNEVSHNIDKTAFNEKIVNHKMNGYYKIKKKNDDDDDDEEEEEEKKKMEEIEKIKKYEEISEKSRNKNKKKHDRNISNDYKSAYFKNGDLLKMTNLSKKNKDIQQILKKRKNKNKDDNNFDKKIRNKVIFKKNDMRENNFSLHLFASREYNQNMFHKKDDNSGYSSYDDSSSGYDSYEYVKHFSLLQFNRQWLKKQEELKIIKANGENKKEK